MTIKLINRGTEGELLLDGRLDAVTSPEAEEIFLQMTERFETLIISTIYLPPKNLQKGLSTGSPFHVLKIQIKER